MLPTGSRVVRALPTKSAGNSLERVAAGQQRHLAVGDRCVMGRGDQREIDRKGDDGDADQQDDMGEDIAEAGDARPSVVHLAFDVAELDAVSAITMTIRITDCAAEPPRSPPSRPSA